MGHFDRKSRRIARQLMAMWRQPLSREMVVRSYRISSHKLTSPLKLVLVTDLHGIRYGKRQGILLEAVKRCRPDLILFAGDIVEKGVALGGVKELFSQVTSLGPCFYVTGKGVWRRSG